MIDTLIYGAVGIFALVITLKWFNFWIDQNSSFINDFFNTFEADRAWKNERRPFYEPMQPPATPLQRIAIIAVVVLLSISFYWLDPVGRYYDYPALVARCQAPNPPSVGITIFSPSQKACAKAGGIFWLRVLISFAFFGISLWWTLKNWPKIRDGWIQGS